MSSKEWVSLGDEIYHQAASSSHSTGGRYHVSPPGLDALLDGLLKADLINADTADVVRDGNDKLPQLR